MKINNISLIFKRAYGAKRTKVKWKHVCDYLSSTLLIILLNYLCLLPRIGYAVNTPYQPVDERMLIFVIGDEQVRLGPEDIEDIDIGVIHLVPIATVEITLNPQAAQAIHDLTATNIGKRMEVHWNGSLLQEDIIEAPLDNEICFSNLSVETAYDLGKWVKQNKQDKMSSNITRKQNYVDR